MSDEELLRSANLILVDPQTNREGPTLAAILLFGKDKPKLPQQPSAHQEKIPAKTVLKLFHFLFF